VTWTCKGKLDSARGADHIVGCVPTKSNHPRCGTEGGLSWHTDWCSIPMGDLAPCGTGKSSESSRYTDGGGAPKWHAADSPGAVSSTSVWVDGYCVTVELAVASFERTSTNGASGSCGWGNAARLKSAIAPGRKTRQCVEPPVLEMAKLLTVAHVDDCRPHG